MQIVKAGLCSLSKQVPCHHPHQPLPNNIPYSKRLIRQWWSYLNHYSHIPIGWWWRWSRNHNYHLALRDSLSGWNHQNIFHPGRLSLVSVFCVIVILLLVLPTSSLEEIFKPHGHYTEPDVWFSILTLKWSQSQCWGLTVSILECLWSSAKILL